MKVGYLVREARRRAGISQVELARRMGTHQSSISRVESDSLSPSVDTLERLVEGAGFGLYLVLGATRTEPDGPDGG